MSEEVLRKKLQRQERQIEILEAMIEDGSRETFLIHEKLQSAVGCLREIYKTVPGAILLFDRKGIIEAANDTALTLLEYAEDELIGQPAMVIFDAADPLDLAQIEALATRREVLRTEKTCRSKSGARIPVLFSTTILNGSGIDSEPRGVVCVALDIRDRKKLELELRQSQKLASIGRLAAGIAHEINTPIQFVSDSIHFVREGNNDIKNLLDKLRAVHRSVVDGAPSLEAAAEATALEKEADLPYLIENIPKAIDRSLEGLGRVATIVRSMKEFAHPDIKEMTPIDLNQAIVSTLTIARNEYKYVADLGTELGELPPVVCHPGDINQVILNIVVNAGHAIADAIKGTARKGQITVRTRLEGESVVVAITDTGSGIPEEIQTKIFDPFFTTKETGKGTGQGLSIARAVVIEKYGGELTFETTVGKGTTFFIRLPVSGKAKATAASEQ